MNPFFGSNSGRHTVDISPKIVMFSVALLAGLYFMYLIRSIMVLLFLAFIIMVALNPAVSKLQHRFKVPRVLSIALVYILVIATFALLFALIIPSMAQQLYQLVASLNLPFLQDQISEVKLTVTELSALVERVGNSVGLLFSIITSTFTGIFTMFTLIVLSFYMVLDRPNLHLKVVWFTRSKKHIEIAREFLDSIEYQLGGWVRGQLILMLVIGFITYVGLAVLGVPYALPLAVLAGMLEILPNVGPTIAAIPSVILAYMAMGPVMAGTTAVFYIVVQQLENSVVVPKILKENVDVNPLVAIVTILVGFELGKVVGALLAIPTYIVVRTLYSFWYRHFVNPEKN